MKNPEQHIPSWRIVGINDLQHWNIPRKFRRYIKAILSVYFYDAASATYCCEITPSHDMLGLRYEVVFTDKCGDKKREEIDEWISGEYPEDIYMHVSDVRRHPSAPFFDTEEEAKAAFEKDPDDLDEDTVREYWQGNWPMVHYLGE